MRPRPRPVNAVRGTARNPIRAAETGNCAASVSAGLLSAAKGPGSGHPLRCVRGAGLLFASTDNDSLRRPARAGPALSWRLSLPKDRACKLHSNGVKKELKDVTIHVVP